MCIPSILFSIPPLSLFLHTGPVATSCHEEDGTCRPALRQVDGGGQQAEPAAGGCDGPQPLRQARGGVGGDVGQGAQGRRGTAVLEALYQLHGASNSSDLEADLGDAAPLFFTRLTSWLRMTYKAFERPSDAPGGAVSILLWLVRALSIFVRGAQYATLLVESGITGALTECLSCGTATVPPALAAEERSAILLLLLYIANAGRVYREMVCDEEGLVELLHTMQQEEREDISMLVMDLLVVVGQGNPRMAPLVHTGLVRIILFRKEDEVARFPGALRTRSETVVLQVARALRAMQMTKELQFYSGAAESEHLLTIVGLRLAGAPPGSVAPPTEPLLTAATTEEYLSALLFLNLHDTNTSLRVEGNELLTLAAKNTQLTARILNLCFDTMDDDHLVIAEEDDVAAIATRQRHQLSCGRAVVQIIISTPMTKERRAIIINLIAMRSAHLTLLKYLRMSEGGDLAAVGDCSKALQLLAKAADEQQRRPELSAGVYVSLAKVGQSIREAVGDSINQVLLFQEISEEESFAILRAARATAAAAQC
ncbi:hypothetical protein STCU_06802 [Strigomonas culicis]|uniref:Ataxin-10 domain-containing protein n=1 Tax=Strigomonas culicis TaxID=28005 RepID=S9VDT0_9TRYP|nr:hypothetical protein STCU_06802 [Strigomonas culicis]|eukprot:EPY25181.1 hypothetical protein STCU_06802 [Strigomonas culicis]